MSYDQKLQLSVAVKNSTFELIEKLPKVRNRMRFFKSNKFYEM